MLDEHILQCPYCGESLEILVDASSGSHNYIEDCQVCCRPIEIRLTVAADGQIEHITADRDDD